MPDPTFSNVVLLLPFDGTNGSTTIVDQSTSAKTATVVGNAQLDTSIKKYGTASLKLDGTNDYLTYADNADWNFGTGQFTIDLDVYFQATPTNAMLVCQWGGGWAFYFESGQIFMRVAPSSNDSVKYTWSPTLNTWYQIRCDRDASNVFRVYVDGVMVSKTTGFNYNFPDSSSVLCIGSLRPAGFTTYDLNGHVDNLRIKKGVAECGSDAGFTPPTDAWPTSAGGISGISPAAGLPAGGTPVTISGSGFTGATDATIGGSSIGSFVLVDDSTITGTSPALADGIYDVVVVMPGTDYTLPASFTVGLPVRVTQVAVLVLDDDTKPVRVTQVPVIATSVGSGPVRVTQVAVMALALPRQPANVTQLAVLVPNLPKPLPIPGPVVPELPLKETWSWKTVINIADKGTEQRSSTRLSPRISLDFDGIIIGSTDRRAVYQMLFDYIDKIFSYPIYVHSTKLTAPTLAGTAKLYFDPASTDMRPGEAIALFDPSLETTELATILTVDVDGVTLTENVDVDVPAYMYVCPVSQFTMRQSVGLEMNTIAGEFSLKIESAVQRDVLRPDQATNLLTMIDGLMVLDKFQLSNPGADEDMNQDVTWLDNGINTPQPNTLWAVPFISGTREYLIHRPFGMDYWRAVGNYLKGRQKAFLLPTFFDDLPLAEVPALGATMIRSSNVIFFGFWRSRVYKYVRIQSKAGVIYRRILEVTANYDDITQEPVTIDIKLSSSIGAGAGANEIQAISFCYTTRLDSDDMVFEHGPVDSTVSIKIRTIEE